MESDPFVYLESSTRFMFRAFGKSGFIESAFSTYSLALA
jgi:hypothetical protein